MSVHLPAKPSQNFCSANVPAFVATTNSNASRFSKIGKMCCGPCIHILDITGDIYFTQLKNISRDKIGKLFHYGVLNAGQKQ